MALFGPKSAPAPQPAVSVSGYPGPGQMSQGTFGQFQQFPGGQPAQQPGPLAGLQSAAFSNIANINPGAAQQNSKSADHCRTSSSFITSPFQICSLTSTNPNKQITTRRWRTILSLTQIR